MRLRLLAACSALAVQASCASAPPVAPPPAAAAPPPVEARPVAPAAPPSASGIWLGALDAGGKKLRIQLRLELGATPPTCSIDSLDQRARGIPCGDVVVTGTSLSLEVPAVSGRFTGAISADGSTLTGTWTQGGPGLPIVLSRQDQAIEPPAAALDPATAPVDLAGLPAMLEADLKVALSTGDLAPATGTGVAVGVALHGARRILSYGAAKPDSLFEIGSITKTFTGLLLAQLAEQKKVRLDEPVRLLLPAGTVAAPASGAEITLLDLSAQRSGLPRMPDNFRPADPDNPYADYDAKALYAFVASHGVALPAKPEFGYSNLGVGLLGAALSQRAGSTYEALLRRELTGPLEMRETVVTLPPALRARLVPGHDGTHKPAHTWEMGALAGAGAIRSTAADMLRYLEAQLHPDRLPASVRATAEGRTLPAAIEASHVLRGEAAGGMHIALNWLRVDATGSYWHNGATGGYSAFAIFNPERDFGVVVLCNTSIDDDGSFADRLGKHIAQRLSGVPAVSLGASAR